MPGVSVITPTGGRPQAFRLAEKYMASQTYRGPLEWIVVDDCIRPTVCTMKQIQVHVRVEPFWEARGKITLARNMAVGVRVAKHPRIVVWEDDDWYGPKWLEICLNRLERAPLVGENSSRYYNIPRRCFAEFPTRRHSSLCQTAFRREIIPLVESSYLRAVTHVDLDIWGRWDGPKILETPSGQCVGIKGLPGRPGVGVGHRPTGGNWTSDPRGDLLSVWIGKDADNYYAARQQPGAGNIHVARPGSVQVPVV